MYQWNKSVVRAIVKTQNPSGIFSFYTTRSPNISLETFMSIQFKTNLEIKTNSLHKRDLRKLVSTFSYYVEGRVCLTLSVGS